MMNDLYDILLEWKRKRNMRTKSEKELKRVLNLIILIFVCAIINVIGIAHAIWFPYNAFSRYFNILWVISELVIMIYILGILCNLLEKGYKLFKKIIKEIYSDKTKRKHK